MVAQSTGTVQNAPAPESTGAPTLLGRAHAVRVWHSQLQRTLTSHGTMMLLAGEAGIGKSALAARFADEARAAGALVAGGAGWDGDGAPGYWPWVQVVRELQRQLPAEQVRAAGGELQLLLGAETPPAGTTVPTRDATFRLFDAVTTLLVDASRTRPVVVVIDDLHWADAASVRLLEFVVRHSWFERVLVLATYRDVEVEAPGHPLQPLIGSLLSRAVTLTITGLDQQDVRALLARSGVPDPEPDLAAEVHRRTGGNPFLVEQVARLRSSGQRIDAAAPGVREAIRARLSQLDPAVVEMLTVAAVLGRECERWLLAAASGIPASDLEPLVAQATAARLLTDGHRGTDSDGAGAESGTLAFVHDLVREALYASIDASDARKRHAAVAAALQHAPQAYQSPSWLAHHAYLAVPEIDPAQARAHLLAAAGTACGRQAAGEVVTHFRRALALVPPDQPRQWAETALDLAYAQQSAGELTVARDTLEQLVALGREQQDPRVFADAALGLHDLGGVPGPGDRCERDLLDEARAVLTDHEVPDTDPLAVRTLAAASRVRTHAGCGDADREEADALSAQAVALARRSGDDEALAFSLLARHDARWGPGTAQERLALTDEMVHVSAHSCDPDRRLQASLLRLVALLELGGTGALEAYAEFDREADDAQQPRWRFLALSRRGTMATLAGRFAEAAEAIDDAFALGERLGEPDRHPLWREQRWALALLQGDLTAAERHAAAFRRFSSTHAQLLAAMTAAERGEHATRRQDHAAVMEIATGYLPLHGPTALRARAQVAVAAGDPRWREEARRALHPLPESWAVVGGGGLVHGPYAYWLAQLDEAEQRWDDAAAGYTAAWHAADRLGAHPWSVLARWRLAHVRHARGEREAAAALHAQVHAEAASLGMRQVTADTWPGAEHGADTEHGADSADSDGAGSGTQPSPADEFLFDGRVWRLTFAGRTVHLPDAKGLRDLHALLGQPGVDVPATALVNPTGGDQTRAVGSLGADTVLDEQARADYRRRLTELDEEIDHAVAHHRDTRAAELDREREALLDELRVATGFGGRPRRLGDTGERTRKTVTARIRDTMRRIDTHHPELAEHLRASVSTGVTCRYQPARQVRWRR